MAIEISSSSTHLVINNAGNVRNINKNIIREVSILGGITLKIDIGGGALRNIFLPIVDITLPVFTDPHELLVLLNAMLAPLELEIESDIEALTQSIGQVQTAIDNILPSSLQEPSIVDESGQNVIYTGFAAPGTDNGASLWAIMRTTIDGEVITNDWAGGTQDMIFVWDDRFVLTYS